ncbi:LytR/AlgR family response regulator transcription factor [Chitinophaga deserti]|uniref:LytR/AlgR family response regulator transcription factor n=1 Tax=Chitinophaga deserti TaxID=2164099 RepID=UPI0018D8BF14|nr:LytTR family DNA-binding domain-containing protein [Chitinophaga deserti]
MEKMKCLVIDDEPLARDQIQEFARQLEFMEVAGTYASALAATSRITQGGIDLLFLDINMPYLSGLDFLESLESPPLCIFITAHSEYALEGFRLQIVDYLLKPIAFPRFYQAASKAYQQFQLLEKNKNNLPAEDAILYVKLNDQFVKISWPDILFVEGMQNYTKLHFKDKVLTIHQTLVALEESLPAQQFFRIHKSYLVNISHIDMISGGRVFVGKHELPISRAKKEDLLNQVVYKKLISR